MNEVVFLICLAFVWIIFASVQDLRKREVANWISFSLIIFSLGFRFFYSLFSNEGFGFFYQGLIGLGIFFVLGNLFYYGKLFAGGDAKLMIAMGAVLSLSASFFTNVNYYVLFIFLFLFVGGFYGLFWSFVVAIKNKDSFVNEFSKQFMVHKKFVYPVMFVGLLFMVCGFFQILIFYLGILLFVLPCLYLHTKAVDECCMVKKLKATELTEGDWLYKDVKVGKKIIKANWEGLSKKDIELLKKKNKFVVVRYGIPFVPVFLISYLILLFLWNKGFSLWFF